MFADPATIERVHNELKAADPNAYPNGLISYYKENVSKKNVRLRELYAERTHHLQD